MEFGSTFVEVLNRKIRKEKVITQVELARVMGVTPVSVPIPACKRTEACGREDHSRMWTYGLPATHHRHV